MFAKVLMAGQVSKIHNSWLLRERVIVGNTPLLKSPRGNLEGLDSGVDCLRRYGPGFLCWIYWQDERHGISMSSHSLNITLQAFFFFFF